MESWFNDLIGLSVWALAKGLLLFALGLYLVFALVVVRQVYSMTKVVSGELDWPIKIVVWFHLGLALALFLLAWLIL